MSWIQKLYETYAHNELQVGYSDNEKERPLLPICHTSAKAQIEIVLDENGNFRRAKLIIDRNDATTIIPCTEESANRTNNVAAHPLCDKIQYIAGDLLDKKGKKPSFAFQEFFQNLDGWCQSKFNHSKAQAVLKYISKESVIKDLVSEGLLFSDAEGRLLSKSEVERERNAEDIFSLIQGKQEAAFVRWVVENPGDLEPRVWRDESLWESWINYYMDTLETKSICYVTGKESIVATKHPRYIRREGDSAKLISSNDTNGYTFRGRFKEADQACNVSLEVSHKAHYALTWLISRQGYRSGDLAIVAWTPSGRVIPQPCESSANLFGMDDLESDQNIPSTAQEFALRLSKKIRGFTVELGESTDIEVIALDSATKGRLAVTYYRELTGSDYLERIENWHRECAWFHDFGYDREKGRYYRFIGATITLRYRRGRIWKRC